MSVLRASVACWIVMMLPAAEAISAEPAGGKIIEKQDVVYGRVHGAGLLADIAYPESAKPIPAIISVHGGRWRGGHKRDRSTIVVKQWADFGLFAMSIDYRLVGCTPAPACYQDVQCAIRFVHTFAKNFNIDTIMGRRAATSQQRKAVILHQLGFPYPPNKDCTS